MNDPRKQRLSWKLAARRMVVFLLTTLSLLAASTTATAHTGPVSAAVSCPVERGGQLGHAIDCNHVWDIHWYHRRQETIVVGTDRYFYHTYQISPGGAAWSKWARLQNGAAGLPLDANVFVKPAPPQPTTEALIVTRGTKPTNGSWYYCNKGNGTAWSGWKSCRVT